MYWSIVGRTNPFSAAIEGIYDKSKFYQLGQYELNLFLKLRVIQPGYKVVEIGCGPGRISASLSNTKDKYRAYGTDFSKSMVNLAQKNVPKGEFTVGNGRDLKQYTDNFFDLVYSFVVFQHVSEPIFLNYIKEARRILKSDRYFIFQIQSSEGLKDYIRPLNHPWKLRRYTRQEITSVLSKNRFANIKIYDMQGNLDPKKVDESGFLVVAKKI